MRLDPSGILIESLPCQTGGSNGDDRNDHGGAIFVRHRHLQSAGHETRAVHRRTGKLWRALLSGTKNSISFAEKEASGIALAGQDCSIPKARVCGAVGAARPERQDGLLIVMSTLRPTRGGVAGNNSNDP